MNKSTIKTGHSNEKFTALIDAHECVLQPQNEAAVNACDPLSAHE